MSETAIFQAARAAVLAAMPTAKDWSDDPSDPKPEKLDAIVVSLARDSATPTAMGSQTEEASLTMTVEIFGKFRPPNDGRADMQAKAEAARAAILGDAALAALVNLINCQTLEVELAQSEERLALGTVTFSIDATV